ncbi:MAG: c-type cytochrome [Alphaproteobacteria bacterium]|jgi:thiosulfate dehydrogenase|nr:c-type cytochrome [Alphaproteobacteria bacterium]
MQRLALSVLGGAIVVGGIAVSVTSASADEMESSLARGGQLYDKWYKVIGDPKPTKSHPAYPADKKYAKKPASNWRCKECHGWDYKGKDGAYASGKHSTGIKGINRMAGADAAEVVAVLKDKTHGYGAKMDDDDLQDVALFVAKGQVDFDKYIDRASKKLKGGDAARGSAYFNTVCSNCHGMEGDKPKDMGKSLGAQMGNPWEVMHKILNGQPDEKMPALRAFDRQVVLDIMAHVATLPSKKLK